MKRNISANECKSMFKDRFDVLTMKEIGIELKHFATGTAPENPSFLVNQEELKKKLIEKFCVFFDENKSQGLEIVFLKSNYGNGKSHFIRMIYSFLNEYENVFARKVSFKQEETDLKRKILESISQKKLKECAVFLVDMAEKESISDEKEAVLLSICEKYAVDIKLSQVLYEAARSGDIARQVQAMAILKGNYLPTYLKNFGCKVKDLSDEFFYSVIRLISIYLKKSSQYVVVVFDEYEHVFSWKNDMARKKLYADIKWFTERMDYFGNLFFVFAESELVENQTEIEDDTAFYSRKVSLTYQIENISSEDEIEKLFKMILKRYQKYYSISLEEHVVNMLQLVKEDSETKTNYRSYTQAIMRVLDQFRNKPPKKKKGTKNFDTKKEREMQRNISSNMKQSMIQWSLKWRNATSISRKTMLCELLEEMFKNVNEEILSKSKKRGEYLTKVGNMTKRYYVVSTDNPSLDDLKKRCEMMDVGDDSLRYVLYPALQEEPDLEGVIFYDETTVNKAFREIYVHDRKCDDMNSYLNVLNKRSN